MIWRDGDDNGGDSSNGGGDNDSDDGDNGNDGGGGDGGGGDDGDVGNDGDAGDSMVLMVTVMTNEENVQDEASPGPSVPYNDGMYINVPSMVLDEW